jgi:hypothetical protein
MPLPEGAATPVKILIADARRSLYLVCSMSNLHETRVVTPTRFNLAPSGKTFRCNFIEPGLISYHDHKGGGMELLRKGAIDKALASAVGTPLTVGHIYDHKDEVKPVDRHGSVEEVSYNVEDGWYYAGGTVDTDIARERLRAGEKPSCAYSVLEFGPGGTHHGVKYDRELVAIDFQHLAIVDKPRFEDAEFRLNSIKTKMFKFIKKILATRKNEASGQDEQIEEVQDVEIPADAVAKVDGEDVRLNDLVSAHKAQKEAAALKVEADKKAETDRLNAAAAQKVEDEKKAKEEEVRKNSFQSLHNVGENRQEPVSAEKQSSGSMEERLARGKARY